MALPAQVLERLSPDLRRKVGISAPSAPEVLPLGLGELDGVLPGGGLLRGGVVELSVQGGAALATRIGLSACRAAQEQARQQGGQTPWCAVVDPSATLHGPGVVRAGVTLERLLVVRPPLEALSRVVLRVVESKAFAVVVIDTAGVPGASLNVSLGPWQRVVRRLSIAVEGSAASVVLITDAAARRPLPLPVAQRIELSRPAPELLGVRVVKDRRGRIAPLRTVAWGEATPAPLSRASERPTAGGAHAVRLSS